MLAGQTANMPHSIIFTTTSLVAISQEELALAVV